MIFSHKEHRSTKTWGSFDDFFVPKPGTGTLLTIFRKDCLASQVLTQWHVLGQTRCSFQKNCFKFFWLPSSFSWEVFFLLYIFYFFYDLHDCNWDQLQGDFAWLWWGLMWSKFPDICLRVKENPGKNLTQETNLTGTEPGPAEWEATMLSLNCSCGWDVESICYDGYCDV